MTEETKKRLRSREWFDIPGDPSATALHIERYTNFGISVAELRSGKPVIGIAQTGSDLVPCNRSHLDHVKRVREGIRQAGGIYIAFSVLGLRNTILGIVMIYPVTTIPVALYMLQGYFRGLPGEIEEAGLMDGLSRLQVLWKITLPLSLPALVSVSLYVFMIAWNEFLLAFMLLDDPSKFTLTRGVSMLNNSEIPRQHLMAGAVIATVPIMALFLGLERFMTKGLAAGSVKG